MANGSVITLECPKDEGVMLVAIDRNGVMVDACPRCRGVWLDRGELDKLIELEAASSSDFADEIRGASREADDDNRGEHSSGHGGKHGSGRGSTKRRKRGGFLGEMFDFG